MAEKDAKADKQRGVVYSLAPSFKTTQTLWAGTDDGLIWVTRDGGKELEGYYAAGTDGRGAKLRRSPLRDLMRRRRMRR